jgi:hypothetical protein
MRFRLAIVLLCLAAAPGTALAGADAAGTAMNTDPRFDRGSWEVGIELNPNVGLEPSIGYFLADNLSASLHFAGHGIAYDNPSAPNDEVSEGELRLDGAYNFPTGGWLVPFLGAGVRSFSEKIKIAGVTTTDKEGADLHGLAGLRFLVGRIGSVNLLLRFGRATTDDNLTRTSQDSAFADLALAYSLFF